MKIRLTALRYLYREHTIYNLLFTVLCVDLLIRYGVRSYLFIFWLKGVGFVGISVVYYLSRRPRLYFFYNLGFNLRDLLLASLVIDTVLSFLILAFTHWIVH